MLVMWDYLKWILYALLISVQLSALYVLAQHGGMPRLEAGLLHAVSMGEQALILLPQPLNPAELERLGFTREGGVCTFLPQPGWAVSALRIRLVLQGEERICYWPDEDVYVAFETSRRITSTGAYKAYHVRTPILTTTGKPGVLDLTTIGREGVPVLLTGEGS